jgi:tetratricopeptide (TPR) repeat protein
LRERELTTLTDEFGRYLFRDLAAGSYTVSFQNESTPSTRAVRLGAEPVDLANVDFQISKPIPSDAPASPAKPVSPAPPVPAKPQPLAPPAPVAQPVQLQRFTTLATVAPAVQPPAKSQPVVAQISDSGLAAAQQHNLLGRQLSKAGRYREAIVELTEALRIAPDFALALNARGFALFMLHDWKRAIADLDQAILLNPNYGNAYHIRGTAKKAIGDTVGAAADLERAQRLTN